MEYIQAVLNDIDVRDDVSCEISGPQKKDLQRYLLEKLRHKGTYCMLLLNIQLKVDYTGPGGCNTEL